MAVKYSSEQNKLLISNVKVFWAKIDEPEESPFANKDGSKKLEYQMKAFVTAEDAEKLEQIGINKTIAEIDVTKKTKGKNRGKPVYTSEAYPDMGDHQFGLTLSCPATTKKGKENTIEVQYEKKPFDGGKVGNGSVVSVMLFAFGDEGEINTWLRKVSVTDLVEYQASGGDDFDEDDAEFGFTPVKKESPADEFDDFEDDDNPFA